MTIDEFVKNLRDVQTGAQQRLHVVSLEKRYRKIPAHELQRIYEKHRNLNFNTPRDSWELLVVAIGFVEIEIIHRVKELYFASLAKPSTWPEVVDRARSVTASLEKEILDELNRAVEHTH